MAYDPNELFASQAGNGSGLRVEATTIQPKTFAAGTALLTLLTPLAFNTSTEKWVVWSGGTSEVNTITANATPATAGTFTLTVDGAVTAAIAYNATAAAVQAALEALPNVAPGDVTAAATSGANLGAASAVVTLTWGGAWAGKDVAITIQTGGLTGNAHVLATSTAGVASNGANQIKGFVWPNPVQLVSGSEVQGNVLLAGKLHYDDIPLPAGETQSVLDAALQTNCRSLGLIVQGLGKVR